MYDIKNKHTVMCAFIMLMHDFKFKERLCVFCVVFPSELSLTGFKILSAWNVHCVGHPDSTYLTSPYLTCPSVLHWAPMSKSKLTLNTGNSHTSCIPATTSPPIFAYLRPLLSSTNHLHIA